MGGQGVGLGHCVKLQLPLRSRVGSDGQSKLSGQEAPLQECSGGLWVVPEGLLYHVQFDRKPLRFDFKITTWAYNNFLKPHWDEKTEGEKEVVVMEKEENMVQEEVVEEEEEEERKEGEEKEEQEAKW